MRVAPDFLSKYLNESYKVGHGLFLGLASDGALRPEAPVPLDTEFISRGMYGRQVGIC